ncbi:hypothetical protein NFI96_021030, partial [Prochilodus magdalenae]
MFSTTTGINMDHNMQVCSTWGNFHFSTFDGQFFQLPYTCNYILATLCDTTKTDFNIQMRRQYINNLPTISSFTVKIEGVIIQLHDGNFTINQKTVAIPSYQYGIRIERSTSFIRISSKLGLTVLWDEHNSLSIEISRKYRSQTCGLCGDFNGVKNNEFIENDKECPFNLEHSECGSPCKDTCSNQEGSQVCPEHCVEGCFCPSGTVWNDLEKNGCIPVEQCPCPHNGKIYQSGESYNTTCRKCECSGGWWSCKTLDCPGTCSLLGGSHITTYDGKAYTFHGNCYYVLTKVTITKQIRSIMKFKPVTDILNEFDPYMIRGQLIKHVVDVHVAMLEMRVFSLQDDNVTVSGNLVQCGQTESETCLTEVKFIIPAAT